MSEQSKENLEQALSELLLAQAKITEAIALDYSPLYGYDPRDMGINDTPGFGPYPYPSYGLTWLNRQKRGEFIPAFLTEQQLSWFRKRIRSLVVNNEIALNAVNLHNVYAIGQGFKYEVTAKGPKYEQYVEPAQAIVDAFCQHNELPLIEAEALSRVLVDGEAFLRLFDTGAVLLKVHFVEPDFVRSPDGDSGENSFGILTPLNNVEEVKGYWIDVAPPGSGPDLQIVDYCDIVHLKHHETPSTSKRGLSAFFPVETALRQAEDLLHSTVSMAKARAKIAWLRKLQAATSDVASALVAQQSQYTATEPGTGATVNMDRYRYGSILTIPANMDIEMPSANIAASDHVTVMQMVLRVIASRFSMPEYMLSSDASNANYSSTLVAESPWVKSMETLQDRFGRLFGRNKYPGPRQALLWRQLDHAIELGYLAQEAKQGLEIVTNGPSLIVRDQQKEAQVDRTYYDLGIVSRRTLATKQGYDYDEEQANRQKDGDDEQEGSPSPGMGQDPQEGQEQGESIFGNGPILEGYEERTDKRGYKYGWDTDLKKRVPLQGRQEKAKKEKKAKVEPEKVKSQINDFLNKGTVSADDVMALVSVLSSLVGVDLDRLKKELGVKASGSKKDKAISIAKQLVERSKKNSPEKKESPKKPETKPEAKQAEQKQGKQETKPVQKTPEKKPEPAKQTKPSAPTRQDSSKPSSTPEADAHFRSRVKEGIESADLSDEQKKVYSEAMAKVYKHLPAKARDRLTKNLRNVRFGKDNDAMSDLVIADAKDIATGKDSAVRAYMQKHNVSVEEAIPRMTQETRTYLESRRGKMGACYSPGSRSLYLDGPVGMIAKKKAFDNHRENQAGVFAHEMAHAIDGPNFEYSRSQEWQSLFKSEIVDGDLTKYAGTKTEEGFAEFGRLVYSGVDLKKVEKSFPKASKFFKDNGLWPE